MAKQTRTRSKFQKSRRAHKRDSVVIQTPPGGNHAERRKVRREAERFEAKAKREAHEALLAKQAEEKAERALESAEVAE